MSQQNNNAMQKHFYRASAADFSKIPGNQIAYWLGATATNAFSGKAIGDVLTFKQGIATSDNNRFLRLWHEVDLFKIDFSCSSHHELKVSGLKWFPYNKGGSYRKWFGNNEIIVNWENDGKEMKDFTSTLPQGTHVRLKSREYYCLPCITYTALSSGNFGCRISDAGFLFDTKGSCIFGNSEEISTYAGLLNSKAAKVFLDALCPSLDYSMVGIKQVPVLNGFNNENAMLVDKCVKISRSDWDFFELSWGFTRALLLHLDYCQSTLKVSYQQLRAHWFDITLEMQRIEEDNNRLFIESYGLQEGLTPDVPLNEITLTCNPHYRYGGNLTDEEREARLQSDTIAELISYAIGCMMGRYSLDREGLVYAHAGNEGFKALVEEGAYATFAADEDGILPLTADNWFPDDVAARFEQFVRTVWDAETLEENLQFIADSLCLAAIKPVKKGGETARETIRRYLSTQFFKDHMKTYKKRPIYWLFSSGKEKAFECLVYLHRYNESTLPRMRTEYVTPLLGQMAGRIERKRLEQAEADTAGAKRIGKDIDSLTKQLTELRAFDDELKHHADMRITLDLDDGVKVNYGKFGTLLSDVKAITGDKGE